MAAMDFNKLLQSLKQGKFAPVYVIDGEEPYFLDVVTAYFEDNILAPHEKDFNLTVVYGKEAEWMDVVNACRRFPMFAERQLVILKDAAQMRTLNELAGYLEHPAPTTVFLIEHRGKKVDGRLKFGKLVDKHAVHYTSSKLKDTDVPAWIQEYGREHGLKIGHQESELLAGYLGNDLQKIVNEIEKVRLNMEPGSNELTPQLIQKYIGISREFNVFGFPEALTGGNKDQLYRMLNYFLANPKNAPVPLLVGTLYNHFERMYMQHFTAGKSAKEIAAQMNLKNEWAAKAYMNRPQHSLPQIEECLQTLAEWSGKFVGIRSDVSDKEWLKEFTARIGEILS
jgi:DNA polymerase-3 subunit delta